MQPVLSILIPTINKRREMFDALIKELQRQISELNSFDKVELLSDDSPPESKTIGAKRNYLLQKASGKYICFFDDDDEPSRNYIKILLEGAEQDKDCLSFRGVITFDGQNPQIFEHSIRYSAYKTNQTNQLNWFQYVSDSTGPITFERYPNHLNAIKSSIAKQFTFPEINHGEDTSFATQVFNSGLVKSEHYIEGVLYHYKYVTNK